MAELAYDFRVIGLPAVKTALRSVERAAIAANRNMMRKAGVRAGERLPSGAAAAGIASGMTARRTAGMAAAAAVARRPARTAMDRRARADLALWRQEAGYRRRAVRDENKERARALRERIRERRKARIIEERKTALADKERTRRAAHEARTVERHAFARAQSMARSRAQVRTAMVGAAGRGVRGAVGGIGRYALMTTGLMGGFAAGAAIGHAKRVEQAAVGLANQAYRAGSGVSRKELAAQVTRTARTVGVGTGLGAEGILSGLRQFVGISGNLPAGLQLAQFMADIADATGADISDVGRTGGQIMQAMMARDIPEAQALKQTMEIFRSMAAQAKLGSIEFRDLATQMGTLISSTGRFEGEIDKVTATMGAFAQLAIAGGASSPEEAMTSIKRFSDDLIQNAHRWEKMLTGEQKQKGFSYFTDETKTKLRAPQEIMMDILRTTGGDLTKVKKLFGIRSMKAIEPMLNIFSEVVRAEGGGEKGIDRALAKLATFQQARMGEAELRGSAVAARQTTGRKIDIAIESFHQAVGEQLLPVVADLVPEFEKLIPIAAEAAKWLGRFASVLAEDPLGTIFRLIALKVSLDIARAGIGTAIRNTLVRSMGAPTVPVGAVGGASPAVGAAGRPSMGGYATTVAAQPRPGAKVPTAPRLGTSAGGAVTAGITGLALGTVTAESLKVGLISGFHAGEEDIDKTLKQGQYVRRLGDKKKLQEHIIKTRERYEEVQEAGQLASIARDIALNPLTNPLGWLIGKAVGAEELQQQTVGVQQQTRLAEIARSQVALDTAPAQEQLDSWSSVLAGTEEQINKFGTDMAAAVSKFNTAVEQSGSGKKPNRSNSPTRNNP